MRAPLVALSIVALAAFAGCAHPAAPAVMPQPTLAAVVDAPPAPPTDATATDDAEPEPPPAPERVKHHVEITVDHLPAPSTFDKAAATYVFWVRASDDEAWSNAAHLDRSDATEEAKFDFAEDTLFVHVTAEATADARVPSDDVVLSTRVSRNGACATSVDQNDVKMKVRMCR